MKKLDQSLDTKSLRTVFMEQLSILYNEKVILTERLPQLAGQATFQNLKHALAEDLEETKLQMIALKTIFQLMQESWLTHHCFGMIAVIDEAHNR